MPFPQVQFYIVLEIFAHNTLKEKVESLEFFLKVYVRIS